MPLRTALSGASGRLRCRLPELDQVVPPVFRVYQSRGTLAVSGQPASGCKARRASLPCEGTRTRATPLLSVRGLKTFFEVATVSRRWQRISYSARGR